MSSSTITSIMVNLNTQRRAVDGLQENIRLSFPKTCLMMFRNSFTFKSKLMARTRNSPSPEYFPVERVGQESLPKKNTRTSKMDPLPNTSTMDALGLETSTARKDISRRKSLYSSFWKLLIKLTWTSQVL